MSQPSFFTSSFAAASRVNVALVVDETEAEGPGKRMAIWVQGCPFRCKGCCNPEMLEDRAASSLSVSSILARLDELDVEGISLLGGEPFAQAAALAVLAAGTQARQKSVMIFSGFRLEELRARNNPDVDRLLNATDVLVDGRYEQDQRSTTRRWIGSTNQGLHFLSNRYSADSPEFALHNTVELRLRGTTLTINGWPVDGAKTLPFLKRKAETKSC